MINFSINLKSVILIQFKTGPISSEESSSTTKSSEESTHTTHQPKSTPKNATESGEETTTGKPDGTITSEDLKNATTVTV